MGQGVGLHDQFPPVLVKPAAAIACPDVNKVHGAVMLRGPVAVLNLVFRGVDQDDAAGPQYRRHAAVSGADVSINVMTMTVGEHSFEMSPLFHHAGKQFSPSRIEGGVKFHGNPQGGGRGHGMSFWRLERRPVVKALFEGNVVPAKDFQGTQVVESRQSVELMQAGDDTPVFNVGQPADVENKVRTPPDGSKFITGALDVPIGQAQSFTGLPKMKTRLLQFFPRARWELLCSGYYRITNVLRIRNKTRVT